MPPIKPQDVTAPKSRIKRVHQILYNGTDPGHLNFSIAELELHNGKMVIGIRYDISSWSKNPDKGYPLIRGQHPCWFILPDGFASVISNLSSTGQLPPSINFPPKNTEALAD